MDSRYWLFSLYTVIGLFRARGRVAGFGFAICPDNGFASHGVGAAFTAIVLSYIAFHHVCTFVCGVVAACFHPGSFALFQIKLKFGLFARVFRVLFSLPGLDLIFVTPFLAFVIYTGSERVVFTVVRVGVGVGVFPRPFDVGAVLRYFSRLTAGILHVTRTFKQGVSDYISESVYI
jgi:hypothetical protein